MPVRTLGLRLHRTAWEARCIQRGWRTVAQRADGLGVSAATISRIQRGGGIVGAGVVAAATQTFGPGAFDELFTLDISDDPRT